MRMAERHRVRRRMSVVMRPGARCRAVKVESIAKAEDGFCTVLDPIIYLSQWHNQTVS
jgi:hypothetical protein